MAKSENKKLTYRGFGSIVFWVIKLYWQIHPYYLLILLVTKILQELRILVYSFLIATAIDRVVEISQAGGAVTDLLPIAAVFVFFIVFYNFVSYVGNYADRALWELTQANVRIMMHQKLALAGINTLEKPEINNQIERARSAIHQLPRQINTISSVIGVFSGVVSAAVIIGDLVWWIIPLVIFISLPSILIDRRYLGLVWNYSIKKTEEQRSASTSLNMLIDTKMLQELSITGGTKYLIQKYLSFFKIWFKDVMGYRSRWYTLTFLADIPRAMVWVLGYGLVFTSFLVQKITVGSIAFYIGAVDKFASNITRFTILFNNLYESSQWVAELKQVFDLPEAKDGRKVLPKLVQGPEIKFENISFSYPRSKKSVIRNLNLEIKSGEKIAIVGHNGAGKTTLVKLLARFYKVSSGEILINSKNINNLKQDSLYKNMGILFQDYNTYGQLTAKENIMIGDLSKKASASKISSAAKKADAHEFIAEYKNKYDQILSEKYKGGIRPSTGQWQKIAIARFFYRDSSLVIFDEPTAAIDAVSEKKIFDKIYKFFKGKTVIIISHRFSTVRNADRIIVLEKGQVVEEGSHEELLKLNGKYAQGFKLQAEGYSK